MSPNGVVSRCQPNHTQPIFVIGVTERGVTVRSQQRRAINLIDALLAEGRLCAGSRIAIIGAGAAGLTAAVRAAQAGIRAHVLERESEILATFRGNHNRLLHPNLYAWPAPNWLNPDAELPVMTWSAAPAGRVATALENQFRNAISHTGLITCTTSAAVHRSQWRQLRGRRGSLLEVAWSDHAGEHVDAVALVILAVGFGREPRTGTSTPFPGY
jgi:glycine/D-amino acid oxidase-like deaminating enzyme